MLYTDNSAASRKLKEKPRPLKLMELVFRRLPKPCTTCSSKPSYPKLMNRCSRKQFFQKGWHNLTFLQHVPSLVYSCRQDACMTQSSGVKPLLQEKNRHQSDMLRGSTRWPRTVKNGSLVPRVHANLDSFGYG